MCHRIVYLLVSLFYFHSVFTQSHSYETITDITTSLDETLLDTTLNYNDTKFDHINVDYEHAASIDNSTLEIVTLSASNGNIASSTEDSVIERRLSQTCEQAVCARKCCPDDQVRLGRACVSPDTEIEVWRPELTLIYGTPPNPTEEGCFLHDLAHEVELLPDGTLFFNVRKISYSTDFYCIENFIRGNETSVAAQLCYGIITLTDFENNMKVVRKVTISLSCIVLFLLIVAHIFKPAMRQKMSEKSFLAMCTALFFEFVILIVNQTRVVQSGNDTVCIMIAIFIQYFGLAFNFWLHIRCFETLRIVRGTVKAIPISQLSSSQSRWLKYSLVCWGIPLLISAFTVIMQTLPDGVLLDYRPQIADGRCWLIENIFVLLTYFYGYQLILHGLNVIYLCTCFFLLYKSGEMRCCTPSKDGEDKMRSYNRKSLNMFWQQFYIFLLFVVILSLDTITLANPRAHFWQIIDTANTLQGVYLVIIFMISSKSRRKLLMDAYRSSSSLAETMVTKISLPLRSRVPGASNVAVSNDAVSIDVVSSGAVSSNTQVESLPSESSVNTFPEMNIVTVEIIENKASDVVQRTDSNDSMDTFKNDNSTKS